MNRSGRDVAFYPEVVVPSCSSLSLTGAQTEAGRQALDAWLHDPESPSWGPGNPVRFERGIVGRPIGAAKPTVIVVSSTAEPQVFDGFVPSELPPCGGEPVGIEQPALGT